VDITLADGTKSERSICVIVKPEPQGGFEIVGQQSNTFCLDSELLFQNNAYVPDGSQIVSSQWDFGDGTSSNKENPSHSYGQSGTYDIRLTVYDECGCSATWHKTINVTKKPGWEISCPTVVCEGAVETYTLNSQGSNNCSAYNWKVKGGHIIQHGNDWVNIVWDDVDESGFGYVYFDEGPCNISCGNLLAAKVPVVAINGTIKGGKTELCQGEQSRYALPRWPTTDVQWSVFAANGPGTPIPDATILVDQRNEIVIDAGALAPGQYTLRADYLNTLLQCGGKAEFQFSVLHDLEIDKTQSSSGICEDDSADFFLTQTISGVTWTFSKGGQTVATVPGSGSLSHAAYQFTEPGHYTVSAAANGYCTDFAEIDVVEIPDINQASILGEKEVCPSLGEDYTFDGDTNGFDVQWYVDHGSFLGPDVGKTVTIKFDDPNYSDYEVSAQLVHPDFANCSSDVITYDVHKLVPNAQI